MSNNTNNISTPANTANTSLQFDELLLTAYEKQFISKGENGQAILTEWVGMPKLAVHSGPFHADECLAVALIRAFWAGPKDHIEVVRTRDTQVLAECLRIDVGEGLLDHHGKRAEAGVAACTRVWQLLCQTPGLVEPHQKDALDPVVQAVAAWDTGDNSATNPLGYVADFSHAANILGRLDEAFAEVCAMVQVHIGSIVTAADAAAKANAAAETVITDAAESGARVVTFPAEARWADVKQMLWENKDSRVMFYVSPEGSEDWRVLCAAHPEATEYSPFSSWELIPEKFRGLSGEQLSEATGIPGGIFCHAAGFIAGFKTREGAEAFARLCAQLS